MLQLLGLSILVQSVVFSNDMTLFEKQLRSGIFSAR